MGRSASTLHFTTDSSHHRANDWIVVFTPSLLKVYLKVYHSLSLLGETRSMLLCRHLDLRRISRRRRQFLCYGSTHGRLDLVQGCLEEPWQPLSYRVTQPEINLSPSASEGGGHFRSGRCYRHPAMLLSPWPCGSPEFTVSSWGKETESAACSLARRPLLRQDLAALPLDGQLVEAS